MKKMIIFLYKRDWKTNRILERITLRTVTVHSTFQGVNSKTGESILSEFRKLADDLEPTNEGIYVTDL